MVQNISQIYQEVISKLKSGKRPQLLLSQELLEEIQREWKKLLESSSLFLNADESETLKKILCILDNTQKSTDVFNELFLKTFQKITDSELLIYTLAASQKHLIAESFKTGKMISYEYFEVLKKLLLSKNPEVKEWALRTIENLGPLNLRLKNEILAASPGISKFFNKHQKKSSQIITSLQNEWKKIKL